MIPGQQFRSNYDKKFLKDSEIPSFYKDTLFSFLDLKSLYNSKDEQEMILFNNKEILIDGRTFFNMIGSKRVSSRCMM